MKMAAIAKASLTPGTSATGVITSTTQTVNVSEHESKCEGVTKDIFDLRDYYSRANKELKNVTGYCYSEGGKHYLILDKSRKFIRTRISGKDIERAKKRKNPGSDISVVREAEDHDDAVYSYDGVTKKDQGAYYDYLSAPRLVIKKETDAGASVYVKRYYTYKEEISPEELDFKLWQYLIQDSGLYKKFPKASKVKVAMKDGGYYTFELNKKLQTDRVSGAINGKNIKKIETNIR